MASCIGSPNKDRPRRPCFSSLFLRSIGMRLSMGAIGRQPIKVRAAPYLSCKNDSGGRAWLRNCIRKCGRCKKFEVAPPVAPLRPLTCSGPGELLHVDFTSIEETVPLREELVIRNVMVMQDHFLKYVVAYVVKDQMARTAAETLRNGYFGLFGAPAYLVSNQGKAFTGHLISNLCELYGVQKLRTSPYHAQTNGQVERMNQMIIRMIGKLEQDKKAHWSEHLPEMLAAYNGTRSAVTGYSPYFLLFGRKSRMPVDCLFPTLCDSPHQAKMEVSVGAMQKRLKEAFAVARHLTS